MDAPTGSILAYATAPGSVAADGTGRNGLYTSIFLKHMMTPNLTIERVFKRVRIDVVKASGKEQIPWESSSLMGDFYFNTKRGIAVKKRPAIESKKSTKVAPKYASISPKVLRPEVIKRDGRFIAYDNGTIKDTKTSLIWAAEDNGENINWYDAKRYCENYHGGGYTDWRMPTQDELAELYEPNTKNTNPSTDGCDGDYHINNLFHITGCCPWSSETHGSEAAYFVFSRGSRKLERRFFRNGCLRTLPVRSGK